MTWLRVDDNFTDHPKIEALSDAAFRGHMRALCYAARLDTEGAIPGNVVSRMGVTKKMLEGFLAAGLWETHPDGYTIHDFLDYNLSNMERAKRIAAGKAGANARWNANRNGHAMAIPDPTRPDPRSDPTDLPPNPPKGGSASGAKKGSKRKRDIAAQREQGVADVIERYRGRERAAAFKARA